MAIQAMQAVQAAAAAAALISVWHRDCLQGGSASIKQSAVIHMRASAPSELVARGHRAQMLTMCKRLPK